MLNNTEQAAIIAELNKIHNLNLSLDNPQSLIDFYNSKEFDKAYFDLKPKDQEELNYNELSIDFKQLLQTIQINNKQNFKSIYCWFFDLLEQVFYKEGNIVSKIDFKRLKLTKLISKIESISSKYQSYNCRYSGKCLVQNVKIYDYLDEEDLNNALKSVDIASYNLDKEEIVQIKDYFDDYKLSDIWNHVLDSEQDYLMEKIQNYHGDFCERKDYLFTFVGNNGGYLAFKNFFDYDYSDYLIYSRDENLDFDTLKKLSETNGVLEFFRFIKKNTWFTFDARQSLDVINNAIDALKTVFEDLKDFDYLAEFCKEVIKNWKECCLMPQLEREIEDFINEELRLTKEKHINTIKIEENSIITDWKATCTLSEAKDALKKLKAGELKTGDKIGNYTFVKIIEKDNQQFAKVGCHLFDLKQIEKQLSII